MENLVQYLLDGATLWVPRAIGVVVIFVVFFILTKIIKRIITSSAARLKFDVNLGGGPQKLDNVISSKSV